MWNESEELKETLKDMEKLKVSIMKQINKLNANEGTVRPTIVYPMAMVQPMFVNNYPVFQFSYEGMLPHYNDGDRDYLNMIRDYYFHATIGAYDFEQVNYKFDDSVIIFAQYFKDKSIRDLDNRNKKYIQDAIRGTRVIGDDNWQKVWTMDLGFKDEETNHVQVYLVSRVDFDDFFSYLMKNHKEMKKIDSLIPSKEQIFLDYQEGKKQIKEKKTDMGGIEYYFDN